MRSSLHRSTLLAAVATVLGAGYSVTALPSQPTYTNAVPLRPRGYVHELTSGYHGTTTRVGRRNAGVSVAQGKRNARKARNVKRHKRSVRG